MTKPQSFDVVVLGGGPGGYVAGIRSAQLGRTVAVVEAETLGGICNNWGCIPTKSLLKDSEVLHAVRTANQHGISIPSYEVDFPAVIKRSRDVAKRLSKGIEYLFKKNRVTHIRGRGRLLDGRRVAVSGGPDDGALLEGKNIIVATGARNRSIPGVEINGKKVISFREAMTLPTVPRRMIIIGAGAIGVEFASFYREFGAEIDLVEMMPQLLPLEDAEIAQVLAASFRDRGINTHLSSRVERVETRGEEIEVHLRAGEKAIVLSGDVVLVAVGVAANTEGIGLEAAGVSVEKGWVRVDEFYRTTAQGIYAIGDVIGPPLLAHVASTEGKTAAEHLSGKNPRPLDYSNIPGCTYSRPQVASIGLTEAKARDEGRSVRVGRFPFRASGKALAAGEPEGVVKVIFDDKYGELVGCHIVGAGATELIAEIGLGRTLEMTASEILRTVHAHPTLSEAILEAVANAYGEAIHI